MAMTVHVDIVSAEAEIFSGLAEIVVVPAEQGEMGILPRHAPLISPLKAGEVKIKKPDGPYATFYVSGGLVEVQPHIVTILSDTAQRAEDLDEAAALEARQRAENMLADRKTDVTDYAHAQAELAAAMAQLQTIQRLRKLKQ